MKRSFSFSCLAKNFFLILFLCLAGMLEFSLLTASASDTSPPTGVVEAHSENTTLDIHGKVVNPHGVGLDEAEIRVFAGDQELLPETEAHAAHGDQGIRTEADGTFQAELKVSRDALSNGLKIHISKPTYKNQVLKIAPDDIVKGSDGFLVRCDATVDRMIGPAFWIGVGIFLVAYILISFELIHRTLAAMLGAALMLTISYTLGSFNPEFKILTYETAIKHIDMNVIFLLMGMMIIIGILKHTGVFQWCAYKCYQLSRGSVIILSIILMFFTGLTSAFLDNVTTMLLLTPVTVQIALSLGISPIALLIPEVLASNVGGAATLIGDPPNIMIGSYAGLSFMDFVINMGIVCGISLVFLFIYVKFYYRGEFAKATVTDIKAFTEELRQKYRITDSELLSVGGIIMSIVIGMFLAHGVLHMEVSIAALFGASILFTYSLLRGKIDLMEVLEKDIEWTTLLFFMFLFMLVAGVESVGFLEMVADGVLRLSGDNLVVAICLVLWASAILSAFVDNIPFTATMMPVVAYLTSVIPGADSGVLWWALAFGACFGGNGTLIGASANVVTAGMAEAAGYPVRFFDFMKAAFPYMVLSVALANIWLLIFY